MNWEEGGQVTEKGGRLLQLQNNMGGIAPIHYLNIKNSWKFTIIVRYWAARFLLVLIRFIFRIHIICASLNTPSLSIQT
jgi:hypothetical protein